MASEERRQALILALLQSKSLREAAKKAKVPYRTASRWHGEKEFRQELKAARREAYEQALCMLQGSSTQAVAALLRNLESKKASDRNAAARSLLGFALDVTEHIDFVDQLNELQKAVDESEQRKPAQPPR
jgi:hypothetical protein